MAIFTANNLGVDFDAFDLRPLVFGTISGTSATSFTVTLGPGVFRFTGSGFSFDATGFPISGEVSRLTATYQGEPEYDLSGFSLSGAMFTSLVKGQGALTAKELVLAQADTLSGSSVDDRLRGLGGNDSINGLGGRDDLQGGAGSDTVFGGDGNDSIIDITGANYLRGDLGDDMIIGGSEFDDINGNQGADTCQGGLGNDWVVGGKDDDVLYGQEGDDLVYGNLGNDTCLGDDGADVVRGGQGNDSLAGGGGSDFLSGDRGDDVITGGAGADIFASFAEAGLDRILDFSVSEGDILRLDPGSVYTVVQIGGDTAVNIVGGAQVLLVGVSVSSLFSSSIIVA